MGRDKPRCNMCAKTVNHVLSLGVCSTCMSRLAKEGPAALEDAGEHAIARVTAHVELKQQLHEQRGVYDRFESVWDGRSSLTEGCEGLGSTLSGSDFRVARC